MSCSYLPSGLKNIFTAGKIYILSEDSDYAANVMRVYISIKVK